MFLLQSAMNAGRLLAAQPGITLADPVVAIAWGTTVFGERIRGGFWLVLAVVAGLVIAGAVVVLSRSSLLGDDPGDAEEPEGGEEHPSPAARRPSSAAASRRPGG
jgi:hypothetical protein